MKSVPGYNNDKQSFFKDLKRGYEPAFDYLFSSRYEELCRFAAAYVGSFSIAEDIVQDFFMQIWESGLHVNRNLSLDSYLYVSVRNGCVSYLRRNKNHTNLNMAVDRMAENTKDPEEWKFVWGVVESLPLQCKTILKLVVLEEMKYAEVAEKMGISINTIKTQMKIAYRTLREKFSPEQLFLFYIRFLSQQMETLH